ncbi:Dop1p NDAI_0J01050 [Naumovozyma dairenensis CBS 421]|uniref:Uncharacterized protein n=1 Tax=Naumovozyma dairenensis (strain ATCC 10597 / BCRC 20456 / CBS 421 / NBRC 0211 / NRRL Y-12639) TaxID=1071378 RepID=G0WGR9_NAUDC|nr:hypothetical protein NDAI_0J01050 [Naumovozyma dairenensis CBS 421]CCD26997.1 hypothetical protein NDAI_0J01050 [Naumovozyma dairenensis CBS 421]
MSLPLKPFTIDSHTKQLNSKQKKFHINVERALERFDSVTEWADYIASLGTLLKALQSWSPKFQNVKYYIPTPYQVSRRLTSSLSPSLPAGVHQKTLEVYTFIFENIGQETLSAECNIWIPGILPLMTYASMSVRSHVIELFANYIVCLPSLTLKLLVRPILASLFPAIDDESSEFLPLTMKLIETLKTNLNDDSLFWQTTFLIISSNKDRRLGGLVWLTKKFPSLNAVPHLLKTKEEELRNFETTFNDNAQSSTLNNADKKKQKDLTLSILLPAAKDLVSPESGLLIRGLIRCLDDDNDLLLKRGLLDLLLQRLQLNSPVLTTLVSYNDRKLLIMSCCRTALNKDMSLNRRIWNWLLGPNSSSINLNNSSTSLLEKVTSDKENGTVNQDSEDTYFAKYGLKPLIDGLNDLLTNEENTIIAFKICLAMMDRWELGSLIIPTMFIRLLQAAQKFANDKKVSKAASTFFDAVETNTIWGQIFEWITKTKDFDFLYYVISTYDISTDEEIIIRHLPLVLLATLSFPFVAPSDADKNNDNNASQLFSNYELYSKLLEHIPERAFLPLSHSKLTEESQLDEETIIKKILKYYDTVSSPHKIVNPEDNLGEPDLPFATEDLTFLIVAQTKRLLISNLHKFKSVNKISDVFVSIIDKIPGDTYPKQTNPEISINDSLVRAILDATKNYDPCDATYSIIGMVNIFSNYLNTKMSVLDSTKLLKRIMECIWCNMKMPNTQSIAIKCLKSLERTVSSNYLSGSLSYCFVQEKDITQRLNVIDLLWTRMDDNTSLIKHPLQLILDELCDTQNPYYLSVSKWISLVLSSHSSNRFYKVMSEYIFEFDFLVKGYLTEMDDLDMFTYRLQTLTNVLKTNDNNVVKNFALELTNDITVDYWKNEDMSTYKNLILVCLLHFLKIENNNHAKSIRSSLLLLDCLLDGTEKNFKDIVIFLLQLSSNYISGDKIETELIAFSLLDIVSKVLKLSHKNGIKLDIFDDNATHLKYIDYLVTSVSTMKAPLVVASYINLLSESIVYFDHSIFSMVLPLTSSIVQCVQRLFNSAKVSGDYYESISLLLGGLKELSEVSHGYLAADEREGSFTSAPSKTDFFQSVVSNVFSTDPSGASTRLQGERDVVLQCFRQVTLSCLDLWCWAHDHTEMSKDAKNQDNVNYNAYKFKFKSKDLLEHLFYLEPSEVLETMINARDDNNIITLIHVLDGNKPAMTAPYLFSGIVYRYNKTTSVKFSSASNIKASANKALRFESSLIQKLSGTRLMNFLIQYVDTLDNAAIEEFYGDFIIFFKEIITNYSLYIPISVSITKFVSIIAEKIAKSQFGEQKRIRKDLADTFIKYISYVFANFPQAIGNDKSFIDSVDNELMFKDIEFIIPRTEYIVNENRSGDKYNVVISTIVTQVLSAYLKPRTEIDIPNYVISLCSTVAAYGSKVKIWRNVVNDFFQDDKKLIIIGQNRMWNDVIYEWSQYPDTKDRLMSDLLLSTESKKLGMTPTLITFNAWNDSEINSKCQSLLRITYLILISPVDAYLLNFQTLITCVCQYLVSKESKIKSRCWMLLRTMVLRFSESHFNDYWSMITYCLQTNLQEFYELLQIQGDINSSDVLQICKSVDLMLTLNIEGFVATNEWLFIIDTINCIYKSNPFMALIDEISEFKDFNLAKIDDVELAKETETNIPLLTGVHSIEKYTQLKNFFRNLSYFHYEAIYSLKPTDVGICEDDLLTDIFV